MTTADSLPSEISAENDATSYRRASARLPRGAYSDLEGTRKGLASLRVSFQLKEDTHNSGKLLPNGLDAAVKLLVHLVHYPSDARLDRFKLSYKVAVAL